jgi:hypothetical protein
MRQLSDVEIEQVRNILTALVNTVNKGNRVSGAVWDVITVLRGPDDYHIPYLKPNTTEKIRCLIGLQENYGMVALSADLNDVRDFARNNYDGCHFLQHINRAVDTLHELGWIKAIRKEI